MIINLKSETELSGFYVVYNGSTNLEKPGWYGIAHLSEHLVCKAFDHLQEDFDRDGISWNAYTSTDNIVFYMTGLDEKINKWKYKFMELLSEFKITKEEFENEKKIVLEEYMDYFNNQTDSHILNLNRKIFNDYDPIGLKQDLINLKYMDIIKFWELQYTKPSKIINVSNKNPYKNNLIDFDDRIIDRTIKFGKYDVPYEINNNFSGKSSIVILSPVIEEDFNYVNFINSMLSVGLKSPLYQEVREKKGLVYYINCYQSRVNKQSINTISTQTSESNFDLVVDSISEVINNPDKYLTKQRMELMKDFYSVRKRKSDILRHDNVNQWIDPENWSIYSMVDKVDYNKIREVYDKYYGMDKFYISNDKTEFN